MTASDPPLECPCGCPLDQPRTGRPKIFCCRACRDLATAARHLVARREAWIRDWRALADAGAVPTRVADDEIARCADDIAEAERWLPRE